MSKNKNMNESKNMNDNEDVKKNQNMNDNEDVKKNQDINDNKDVKKNQDINDNEDVKKNQDINDNEEIKANKDMNKIQSMIDKQENDNLEDNKIIITSKLNSKQKVEAAKILYHSFPLKFPYLWLYNKTENKAFQFFRKALKFNYGIYAVISGKVVGILGLDLGVDQRFVEYSLTAFTSTFGLFGGVIRYIGYSFERNFIHTKTNVKQSRIDPIAVSADARGKGVGSTLLNAFEENSKNLGNKSIVLEVVDTNPRAKKLYEKEGYVAYKYLRTALFTKKAGFKGLYYMKKNLDN